MQSSRLDELLRAERAVAPEPGDEARIWAAIEHRLSHGPPPPAGGESAPGALGGALKTGLLKVAVGVALVAAGVGALASRGGESEPVREDSIVAAAEPEPGPPPPAVAPVAAPPAVVAVAEPAVAPVAEPPPVVVTPVVEPAVTSKKSSRSKRTVRPDEPAPAEAEPVETEPPPPIDIQAELALIKRTRGALKAARYAEALELVDEHVRRFGARGLLVQERMFLEYLGLCALERFDAAHRVADELKREWPDSTHLPHLSKCAGE